MGCTTLHRDKGLTNDEFFLPEVIGEGREILASSTIKNTYYAAVRETKTGEVWALVVLISRAPRSYHNFGYKDMTEDMGPCEASAPAKVLDLLTETDSKYANEWRAQCRANLDFKAAQPKVKPGDTIRIPAGLTFRFGGEMVDVTEFVFRERNVFRTVGEREFLVRIRNWKDRKFELVSNSAKGSS